MSAVKDPTESVDLSAVEGIVAAEGVESRSLIAILQSLQRAYGYLPPEALERVCDLTEITRAQIMGVATFYNRFRLRPVGRHRVQVCHGTACHMAGAPAITESLRRALGLDDPEEDTDADRLFTVERVACIGCCSLAPCLQIDGVTYGHLTPRTAPRVLRRFLEEHGS